MESNDRKKPTHSLMSNIRYLYKMHWKYSKLSLLILFLELPISLSLSYLGIYLPKVIIQQIMDNYPFVRAIMPVILIGAITVLLNILSQTLSTINFALLSRFRTSLVYLKAKKCLSTDYENIEAPKFRLLMQRADEALWGSGDGSAVEQMNRGVIDLLTCILGYILFGTILSFANPILIIILTILPITNYFVLKSIQKFQYKIRYDTTPIDKKIWYIASNAGDFNAAKDVRMYGMNNWLLNMFKEFTKQRLFWDKKVLRKYFLSNIIDGIHILIRDGVAYLMLIFMVTRNEITIDNFVLYFAAIGTFTGMVGGIVSKLANLNAISLTTCDLRDFLDYNDKNNITAPRLEASTANGHKTELTLQNVSYIYPGSETETIKQISLKIHSGEKIALVGLNGVGKTTLVKIITGLYRPTTGQVLINGKQIDDYNIYDYYSLFSVVFQDSHFLPISIANIISCSNDANTDNDKVIKSLKNAGLYNKIAGFERGIHTLLNRQINDEGLDLSGGEKQKLLLARALYKDAPILILDEPTAALDPIAENELYLKYNTLFKDKTSIFISHRLSSTRFCDRIILIENGIISEMGSHDELIRNQGTYANLYALQSKYYVEKVGGLS